MQSLLILTALGLAAYRGTQLVVHDSITKPMRSRIEVWHAKKHESRIRTFVRDLISCTYCTGFHMSWIALLAYLLASGTWDDSSPWVHAVEAFTVAGAQALFSRFDDTLGEN